MPVVVCSSCKVRINVKDEMLGKKAKCPNCKTLILLEAVEASAAAAPKPKPKPKPPPVPAEDDDEPAFEAVKSGPPKKKPAPAANPFADMDEQADDEPAEDDDEAAFEEVAEPEPRGKKRRGKAYDEDEDDEDDEAPRKKRGRSSRSADNSRSGDWSTARTGLRLVFFASIAILALLVLMQITSIVSGIMVGQAFDNIRNAGPGGFPKGFPQPPARQVGAGIAVLGMISIGLMVLLVGAAITNLVGQIMCCFAPPGTAQSRARISIYTFIAIVVVGILGSCGMFAMLGSGIMAMGQQNPNNPQAAANAAAGTAIGMLIVMGLFAVTMAVLAIVYIVFWVLFHAAVADTFGDKALKSQIIMYLAAVIVGPFLAAGIQFGLAAVLITTSFVAYSIISGLLSMIVHGALMAWYLLINRRLVQLIDENT